MIRHSALPFHPQDQLCCQKRVLSTAKRNKLQLKAQQLLHDLDRCPLAVLSPALYDAENPRLTNTS